MAQQVHQQMRFFQINLVVGATNALVHGQLGKKPFQGLLVCHTALALGKIVDNVTNLPVWSTRVTLPGSFQRCAFCAII